MNEQNTSAVLMCGVWSAFFLAVVVALPPPSAISALAIYLWVGCSLAVVVCFVMDSYPRRACNTMALAVVSLWPIMIIVGAGVLAVSLARLIHGWRQEYRRGALPRADGHFLGSRPSASARQQEAPEKQEHRPRYTHRVK